MRTWAIALIAAGCYHANFAENVPCSADLHCPDGQVCDITHAPPVCVSSLGSGTGFPDGGGPPDSPVSACGICDPAKPVCDPDSTTCRRCYQDSECASDVCSESTGTCIAESNALYVRPSGDDSGTCTRTAPCATISHAVSLVDATRYAIKVHDGDYDDSFVSTGASYLVSGEADGNVGYISFRAFGGHDHLAEIQGGTVVIEELMLDGGHQETMRVQGGAQVTLFQSEVLHSPVGGIDVQGSTLDLEQTDVHDTIGGTAAAINVENGSVTIRGSVVYAVPGACVRVSGATFTIENSFLVGCGAEGFAQLGVVPALSVFQFNTVASNGTGATCTAPVTLRNTIFANNGAAPQLAGCGATYSLFTDVAPAGTGNLVGNPAFVATDDDHITFQSAARNKGDPASTLAVDYDGEPRPHGAGYDIGADEQY